MLNYEMSILGHVLLLRPMFPIMKRVVDQGLTPGELHISDKGLLTLLNQRWRQTAEGKLPGAS